MRLFLYFLFGFFSYFIYSQDYTIRFYVKSPRGFDSADFAAHIDPMHITYSNYIVCSGKKFFFHRVCVKSDSLLAEVNDFPVVFKFSWNHKSSFNYGYWTNSLKPGFYGKAALITHKLNALKTLQPPGNEYRIEFNFKNPLKGTLLFTDSTNQSLLSISILSPAGDFGYIQGYFKNDSIFASSFNGSGFFILKGKLTKKEGEGIYISEKGDVFNWKAYSISKPEIGTTWEKFTLPSASFSMNGITFDFNHDSLKGKPLIIHVLGSWCHNCRDEVMALKEFVKKYSSLGARFYAIVIEKQPDTSYVLERVRFIRERWGIFWPILITSKSTKDNFAELFAIKAPLPYPTTFMFDKKHHPYKIHVGFSGPATGKAFEAWKKEFEQDLKKLTQ